MNYPDRDPLWHRFPSAQDTRPHHVYELWSGDRCTYVGMTVNLQSRLADHRRYGKTWDRLETTTLSSRRSAEGLESRLILLMRPCDNTRYNPTYNRWLLNTPTGRVLSAAYSP